MTSCKNNRSFYCGRRANAVICDYHFPMDTIHELFLPLANIEPSYGLLVFQEATLEADLKEYPTIENYEIDLEGC